MFGFYEKHFTIFGLDIAYYGLIIAVGMGLGVFLACKNAKYRGLRTDDIIILACYVLPLAIIGARVYYVLFSLNEFTSFWQVFEIWKGGMAIYGGVIGGAIGVMLYCLIHKKNFLDIADVVVPSLILGQAIGRWGNFFNQEAYGYFIENSSARWFPIGVYIEDCSQAICHCGGSGWHLATFFYESIWNLGVFVMLLLLLRKSKTRLRGSLMCLYFIGYGAGRVWIEGLRTDSLYIGAIRVSQFLSILLIIFGIVFIIVHAFLYKKGKVRDLLSLQSFYEMNLKTKKSKKILQNEENADEEKLKEPSNEENIDKDKNSQDKEE